MASSSESVSSNTRSVKRQRLSKLKEDRDALFDKLYRTDEMLDKYRDRVAITQKYLDFLENDMPESETAERAREALEDLQALNKKHVADLEEAVNGYYRNIKQHDKLITTEQR